MAASMRRPPVSFTLPIACQICLGKVKEPVICSNLHVSCNSCMEVWLQHKSHCPTCRVPITTDKPCKQILGGSTGTDEAEWKKSTPELRKMRFELLYREYETDLEQLQEKVNKLTKRNAELEDVIQTKNEQGSIHTIPSTSAGAASVNSSQNKDKLIDCASCAKAKGILNKMPPSQKDSDEILSLLQKLRTANGAQEKLKEENTQLRGTNAGYLREIGKLKQDLIVRSPRKYEKYALAAQQSKLEKSEQEVKQLKRALERSDMYVEELECKLERYQRKHGDIEPETPSSSSSLGLPSDLRRSEVSQRTADAGGDPSIIGGSCGMEYSVGETKDIPRIMDDGEPAAKKFYARERKSWTEYGTGAQSTSFKSWRTVESSSHPADHRLDSPKSSETEYFSSNVGNNPVRSYEQGSPVHGPSTSRTSPKTPNSVFKTLRVNSGAKEKGLSASNLDNPSFDSQRLPKGPSPRRQLNFLSGEQGSSQAQRQDRQRDDGRSSGDNLVAGSTSLDNQQTLNPGSSSGDTKGNREVNRKQERRDTHRLFYGKDSADSHDETLNELDISLTPEFVDCARLMKAAEQRVKQRSRSSENDSSDKAGQSSAFGSSS